MSNASKVEAFQQLPCATFLESQGCPVIGKICGDNKCQEMVMYDMMYGLNQYMKEK